MRCDVTGCFQLEGHDGFHSPTLNRRSDAAAARVPLTRASDAEAARKAKDRQARELAAKGELILWDVKPGAGQLGIWGLLRTVSYSPVGAMLGLGLLVLCWLAGCV